jgi:hypothetical protein
MDVSRLSESAPCNFYLNIGLVDKYVKKIPGADVHTQFIPEHVVILPKQRTSVKNKFLLSID